MNDADDHTGGPDRGVELDQRDWDVIVVGAGPAGSVAAREAARYGARTLLVDKRRFPRPKACGCCLSRAAVEALERIGIECCAQSLDGVPLDRVDLHCRGARVSIGLPGGIGVSRQRLDWWLVAQAVDAGARFLPGVAATPVLPLASPPGTLRRVRLGTGGGPIECRAGVVLACDGLGGRFADELGPASVRRGSRIGLSAMIRATGGSPEPGQIEMSVGEGGYVGLVRVEEDWVAVAAAVDPGACRAAGGPARLCERIRRDAGTTPAADLHEAKWMGTAALTRRRRCCAGHRLLVVGDAGGYVEPFTGEGMAWAVVSGAAAGSLAARAARRWSDQIPSRWEQTRRRLVEGRASPCRGVSRALRHPGLIRVGLRVPGLGDRIGSALAGAINAPYPCG